MIYDIIMPSNRYWMAKWNNTIRRHLVVAVCAANRSPPQNTRQLFSGWSSCSLEAVRVSLFSGPRIERVGKKETNVPLELIPSNLFGAPGTGWWGRGCFKVSVLNGYAAANKPARHGDVNLTLGKVPNPRSNRVLHRVLWELSGGGRGWNGGCWATRAGFTLCSAPSSSTIN